MKYLFLIFLIFIFSVKQSRLQLSDNDDDDGDSDLDLLKEDNNTTNENSDQNLNIDNNNITNISDNSTDSDSNSESDSKESDSSDSSSDSSEETTHTEEDIIWEKSIKLEGSKESEDRKKLLIILVSGLRYDYISRDFRKLKGFQEIIKRGTKAIVEPVFPSMSFPNYVSITTGLYPSKHNMINNYMYSKKYNEVFDYSSKSYSHRHWWNRAEPIWTRAKSQNLKVSMYWWPGCEIEISNINVDKCIVFKEFRNDRSHDKLVIDTLDTILDDFANDTYDLSMLFYNNIDTVSQEFGPESKSSIRAVRKFDMILKELIKSIDSKSMNDSINVYIISDHGMTTAEKIIELENIIDFNDVKGVFGNGAFLMILPEEDKEYFIKDVIIRSNIPGLNVYTSDNLPDHFHIAGSDNILPLILTADKGYFIKNPQIPDKVYPSYDDELPDGVKGYDPTFVEEVKGVMFAFGPDIQSNSTIKEMSAVDHYNVFCFLLDIDPRENDGEWRKIYRRLIKKNDDLSEEDESSDSDSDESDENNKSEENEALVQDESVNLINHNILWVILLPIIINIKNNFNY